MSRRGSRPKPHKLLWVRYPGNRKTDCVPTAYVGDSFANTRKSCEGCALLGDGCYAWAATSRGFGAVLKGYKADPKRYSWKQAIDGRRKRAKMIRYGALGDPARADRREVLESSDYAREQGLSVIGYTHHWREEPVTGSLRNLFMASCNSVAESEEALQRGWTPAMIIPWNFEGKTFEMPGGKKGLVCPAQTRDTVTCNDCRMCDVSHPVWSAGKIAGIGFKDHGPKVRPLIKARKGKALPVVG